jgi:hypothetical protein
MKKYLFIIVCLGSWLGADAAGKKLNLEALGKLKLGMTEAEVVAIMGEPAEKKSVKAIMETREVWMWRQRGVIRFVEARIVLADHKVIQLPTGGVANSEWEKRRADEQAQDELMDRDGLLIRKKYVSIHPELPEEHKEAILTGTAVAGMARKDVIMAMGEPIRKSVTATAAGRREQLVYGTLENGSYVYIVDGVVDAVETHSPGASVFDGRPAPGSRVKTASPVGEKQEAAQEVKPKLDSGGIRQPDPLPPGGARKPD